MIIINFKNDESSEIQISMKEKIWISSWQEISVLYKESAKLFYYRRKPRSTDLYNVSRMSANITFQAHSISAASGVRSRKRVSNLQGDSLVSSRDEFRDGTIGNFRPSLIIISRLQRAIRAFVLSRRVSPAFLAMTRARERGMETFARSLSRRFDNIKADEAWKILTVGLI